MDSLPDAPYRERRAPVNHLVQTVPEAGPRCGARAGRVQACDDVGHQAHAAQHTRCDRWGTPFRREALHPESSTVAGSALACPRCHRAFGHAAVHRRHE
jgi:hypothetical protein